MDPQVALKIQKLKDHLRSNPNQGQDCINYFLFCKHISCNIVDEYFTMVRTVAAFLQFYIILKDRRNIHKMLIGLYDYLGSAKNPAKEDKIYEIVEYETKISPLVYKWQLDHYKCNSEKPGLMNGKSIETKPLFKIPISQASSNTDRLNRMDIKYLVADSSETSIPNTSSRAPVAFKSVNEQKIVVTRIKLLRNRFAALVANSKLR
eukprot:NODE_958_length_2756_cov_0.164471.p1 type:complete len:206 gc:universal NODE_958_length_2756_cov_0.164471:2170-1553(-)